MSDTAPEIIRIPTPPTHDISHIPHHAPNFRSVAARLQESVEVSNKGVERDMARRGKNRYTDVQVLLLSWKSDDLSVLTELEELGHMFEKTYHYQVQYYEIPDEMPGIKLQGHLLGFVSKHADLENLLIVCYAGHAIQDPLRSEPPIWVARRTLSARLPSGIVQAILAECSSDVLMLYDCCHASPTDAGVTGCGVTETLAACGFEGIAAEVGKDSFTNALIEELGTCWRSPIAVIDLHNRLIQRLRTYKPGISRGNKGKRKYDEDGNPLWERSRRKTPVHAILTSEQNRKSIFLAPQVELLDLMEEPSSGLAGLTHGNQFRPDPSKPLSRYVFEDEDGRNNPETEARVLLTVRVSTPELDIAAWREWIRDLPPDGTSVRIESAYGSFSTLLLLTVPVTIWDLLPDDPAYSFVGFVTTGNLLPELKQEEAWPRGPVEQGQPPQGAPVFARHNPSTGPETGSWTLAVPGITQSLISPGSLGHSSSKDLWSCVSISYRNLMCKSKADAPMV